MSTKLDLPVLDDRAGPAPPIADDRARRLVGDAVDRVFAQPGLVRGSTYGKWPLVLAAALVVGIAAASSVLALRRRAPLAAPATVQPTASLATGIAAAPTAAPEESSRDTTVPPDRAPAASALPESAPGTHAMRQRPEDLLRQANELRAARRWRDAARAYERVLAVHPGSPEAYAATVAAADLRLEQLGDPHDALKLYRAAQQKSPQGPLAEQVLWGIARSDAALGDREGERRSLQEYLSRYPAGLDAPEARARLAALPGTTP